VVSRAASFALAMLAVLTLIASGGFHELLHADERQTPSVQTASLTLSNPAAAPAPDENPAAKHGAPQHGCSGHCAAHMADQAPTLVSMPTPPATDAAWRVDRGAALQAYPSGGQDRPPRA
jgi:hypothetical protein